MYDIFSSTVDTLDVFISRTAPPSTVHAFWVEVLRFSVTQLILWSSRFLRSESVGPCVITLNVSGSVFIRSEDVITFFFQVRVDFDSLITLRALGYGENVCAALSVDFG